MNWLRVRDYLLARLSEASTWRGVVLLLSAIGANLTPDQTELILSAGVGLAGLIGAALPDKKE